MMIGHLLSRVAVLALSHAEFVIICSGGHHKRSYHHRLGKDSSNPFFMEEAGFDLFPGTAAFSSSTSNPKMSTRSLLEPPR